MTNHDLAADASTIIDAAPADLLIGGRWQPASDGSRIPVIDPATGATLTEVASATVEDARAAVAAAADAGSSWAATAPRERAEILRRTYDAMIADRDRLAALIVLESGKSWSDAFGEVTYAAEFFRWFAEEAVRVDGRLAMAPAGDKRILTVLRPVGVSVLITPWNFPAAMATRKIGPALAAGCTVVLKPASDTPLTALRIAQMAQEAGAPAGVINVVVSRRTADVVDAMLSDSATRKLSFTGSTEVGRILLEKAAQSVLDCSMELGGNAPFVVFGDADIDAAVDGAMIAKMRNGGASCVAANRFIVAASIADEFSSKLADRMGALKVGHGLDPTHDVGAIINERERDGIARVVDQTCARGARALVGGRSPDLAGSFYQPTVLVDIDQGDEVLNVEVFGPVAPVVTFDDDDQALALANATEHGLAAYVYSGDLAHALAAGEQIEAGVVGINRGLMSDPAAPFGGMKHSGLGREGAHEGLLAFTSTQYLAASW